MGGAFSIWHWIILLIVVVLVFGTGKLRNMGKDLGGAVKGFKEGMREAGVGENNAPAAEKTGQLKNDDNTIDGQVAKESSDIQSKQQ